MNPNVFSKLKMKSISFYNPKDFPTHLPKLKALYNDLFSGGKGLRGRLIKEIGKYLPLSLQQLQLLTQSIEFIHNASLLHDDLLDRSQLRRDKPAAWLKYTPEYAVLAGDYLLARTISNLSHYGNLQLVQYTAETISRLLEGEWVQDSLLQEWSIDMTQLDYVHQLKTASLFKWCFRAPFLCLERYNQELHQLLDEIGGQLGLLFQRSDDLLDFDVRNYEKKQPLSDLKSGYLNSFGAFIASKLSYSQGQALKKSRNMSEVKQIVNEEFFQTILQEFDEKNGQVIRLYLHYVDSLEIHLEDNEKGLLVFLRSLPNRIYWRRR